MKKFLKALGKVFASFVGLIVLVWLGHVAYFTLMTHDIVPGDDSDVRLAVEPVPDAENAYVAFLAVTNLCVLPDDGAMSCMNYRQLRRTGRVNAGTDTNALPGAVDRVLADNAPYFAGLHKAAACPRYGFVKDGVEWGWIAMPPVTAMMRANTLWTTKAMRETERRDYAAALETIRDHQAFGRTVAEHPSNAVALLVGLGIWGCANSEICVLAASEDLPGATLDELAAMARDEIDLTAAFARAVKCEYGNGVDKLCEMIRNETQAEAVLPLVNGLFGCPGCYRGPSFAERCFAWTPGFLRFSLQPGATKQVYADAVRAMLKGIPGDSVVPKFRSIYEPNWAGRAAVRRITASLHSQHDSLKRSALGARMTRTVVAAQRYRRTHGGAYPPTLDALVPAFLDAVPHDPYAPEAPLRYDAAKGVVWSVGENGGFDPFPEKPPHSRYRFDRDRDRYAVRLDGKPHEKPMKKVKAKGQGQEKLKNKP